jgi:carbon monoxide dehydrogenase subunit G
LWSFRGGSILKGLTRQGAIMSEVRFDGVLPIPRAEVFDFLSDARNWPAVLPGVQTVDHVEGWGAPGGRCRLTIRLLGRGRTLDCEMLESERPNRFRYVAHEEGHPDAHNDCRFVEEAGGTRVQISARQDARRSLFGLYDRFVAPWALQRLLNRQMVSVTTTLADRRGRASGS